MPIHKKPSSSVREVDIQFRPIVPPKGSPAVFIGTSRRGLGFVPLSMGTFDSFKTLYGNVDANRFGPIALQMWLKNKQAATFIRLLGIGDGKKRLSAGVNSGKVNNAGFVVGSQQVQSNGMLGHNVNAEIGGLPGRTYFLGCFMSESNGSTFLSDAGIQQKGSNRAKPILRAVLFAASGVHLSLNTEATSYNEPSEKANGFFGASGDGGLSYGDILVGDGHEQNFIVLLNGFKSNGSWRNSITASFLPNVGGADEDVTIKSLRRAFNTNPEKLEEAGHLLRTFYDTPGLTKPYAKPTGSGVTSHCDTTTTSIKTDGDNYKLYQTAFLLSSSLSYNSGSSTKNNIIGTPNFENFENRYTNAFSPWVFSQRIDGKRLDLFRIFAQDDGIAGASNYKITISNITPVNNPQVTKYGTFDLTVRKLDQTDLIYSDVGGDGLESPIERWTNLSLNPRSDNFISKIIGDQHRFYDFDKRDSQGQKEVIEGLYEGQSRLIRVEVSDQVEQGVMNASALPVGFRGLHHLVTSGSSIKGSILSGASEAPAGSEGSLSTKSGILSHIPAEVTQFPIPHRENIFILDDAGLPTLNTHLTWGFQFENKHMPEDPNGLSTFNTGTLSFIDYMPDFHTGFQNPWVGNNHGIPDVGSCILDADRFNKNIFSLENIEVLTGSNNLADPTQWRSARYRRDGKPFGFLQKIKDVDGTIINENSRMILMEDFGDATANTFLKFSFPLQGGFDGTNIFDYDKSRFTNDAVIREVEDPAQGGIRSGPTISAYKKAINILENKTYPGHLLTIPGIREPAITEEALEMSKNRFDMFYIMDIPERGPLNQKLTGTLGGLSDEEKTAAVENTRTSFIEDPSDTTFGAAYYPDVFMPIPNLTSSLRVPPSVAVVSIYGKLSADFKKPLGPKNPLPDGTETETKFNDEELEKFYQSGINVIQSDPNIPTAGPFIRSQETFADESSPLSKISIRRMLLEVRRKVKRVLISSYLFDQNNRSLRSSIQATIEKELSGMRSAGAFKSFSVKCDSETTSKNDIERNIVRAKVIIVPKDASKQLILDIDSEPEG